MSFPFYKLCAISKRCVSCGDRAQENEILPGFFLEGSNIQSEIQRDLSEREFYGVEEDSSL
ncbi:hypothetical protein PanWU01x14_238710 [Parasponia andersonii]|uniref:Uncharacterized protein n=1 Tax=Parasponia andersonii TaxID=3476 RepID=A0A2P5BHE9_PARAD|nr:hypothetical protein PanWU01x14_238710 [Parasponia andersonii]